MAGEIYLSNLSGRFDYQQILQKYQQLKFQQVDIIQKKEQKIQQEKAAFKSFADKLEDFKKKFENFTDPKLFDQKSVTVSNEDIASVSVTDGSKVNPTKLSFTVTQLAKNDVWLSKSGVADRSSAVASSDGTLTLSYKGNDYNIDYTSSDTIDDIAQKINQNVDDINASVFFDGTNYRLILSGKDTGTDSAITLSDSGDLLDNLQLGSSYSDSHVQSAQNAIIDIYGQQVESQSNTFHNVIDGVDIIVKAKSSDPVKVDIQNDDDALKKSLEDLFSSYNSLVDFIKEKTGKNGELSGDFSLQSIRSAIFNGLTPLMDKNLISVDHTNGHISLKSDSFDMLVKNDREALQQTIDTLKTSLQPYIDSLFDPYGVITQKEKNYDRQIQRYEDRIDATIKRIDQESENLKRQFIHLDSILAQLNDVKTRIAAILPKEKTQ